MQRYAEQVFIRADLPRLRVIEVHVAGQGFGIRRRGVKCMREHAAAAIERIAVAVIAGRKQDVYGLGRIRRAKPAPAST